MTKILVIRFSSLGDVVLATPVFRNLKEKYKDCEVTVAVKGEYVDVLSWNPYIDHLFVLWEDTSLLSLVRAVRQEKFDILIDLHNNLRSNLVSFFSGARLKIRYRKDILARRLFVKRKIKTPELNRHTAQRYLETLKMIGIDQPGNFKPEIFFDRAVEQKRPPLRFLVVQTAFLGDAVLTTPLLSSLYNHFPTCKISVLCTPEIKPIFTGNQEIGEILVMDKRGKESGIFSLWNWAQRLRGRYDIVLLPHRSFRSAFLVWLAGIPKRIGFENSGGKIFLTDVVPFQWEMHDSNRNLRLLEALGIQAEEPVLKLPARESPFDFKQFCDSHHIPEGKMLIGMNPGSMWKTKRWLPEYFAQVADTLQKERNCQVILFGSDQDKTAVRSVCSFMKSPVINLCGKTDLKTLTSLISRCSLFITNDSGPMHLASAAGVPLVAIFGPTTRELGFFPLGDKSVVVELELPCRPCSLHGGDRCPLEHFKCMRDLRPEVVLRQCRLFLQSVSQ